MRAMRAVSVTRTNTARSPRSWKRPRTRRSDMERGVLLAREDGRQRQRGLHRGWGEGGGRSGEAKAGLTGGGEAALPEHAAHLALEEAGALAQHVQGAGAEARVEPLLIHLEGEPLPVHQPAHRRLPVLGGDVEVEVGPV